MHCNQENKQTHTNNKIEKRKQKTPFECEAKANNAYVTQIRCELQPMMMVMVRKRECKFIHGKEKC